MRIVFTLDELGIRTWTLDDMYELLTRSFVTLCSVEAREQALEEILSTNIHVLRQPLEARRTGIGEFEEIGFLQLMITFWE